MKWGLLCAMFWGVIKEHLFPERGHQPEKMGYPSHVGDGHQSCF